jgi:hypothetical protein
VRSVEKPTKRKESKLASWHYFLVYFFGGLECVGHSFAFVVLLVFLEMSGFEPREQAGVLTTLPPISYFLGSWHFNYGSVAEQIDEISSVKNPPNCVGGIRVFIRTCYIFSRFAAPYEIHSYSVYIA